ncbi:MAG: sigma-54-dependent Fis family transcriptional regulator [Coriobacteriia bacterium]
MEHCDELVFEDIRQHLLANEIFMDEKAWHDILDAKLLYLNDGVSPIGARGVRPEIAQSWARCVENGVDPENTSFGVEIGESEYQRLCGRRKDLIEAVRPLTTVVDQMGLSNDYVFELLDRSGVSLIQTGNLSLHEIIAPRGVFDELGMGTNAHSLCMRYKSPFQVVGPEHFCFALHGLAADAAPILTEDGEAIAALVLTQPLPEIPWSADYHRLQRHTLGLVASLASAAEQQLRYFRTRSMLSTFETAIDTSTEGTLVINRRGTVLRVSPEAAHLLQKSPSDIVGKPLNEVLGLGDSRNPLKFLDFGKETAFSLGTHAYSIRASLATNDDTHECDGFIVKLREQVPSAVAARDLAGDVATVAFDDILGPSETIRECINLAKRFAATDESVLISGETGTGKEYFAQAIHNASCPTRPFMSINCAAIPPRLIESELFGYEGGAFTGAERGGRPGKIELADGGTLFLDEIGDMPLELQATLLRVIETKRVMRLGGRKYKQVNFRLMAATNRNMFEMVEEGSFREDLLYRLSVLTLKLPPLRERAQDISFFARYYLNECRRKYQYGPEGFTPEAFEMIENYSWPGNVRQIKNAVLSAYHTATGAEITLGDLPTFVTSEYFADQMSGAACAVRQPSGSRFGKDALAPTLSLHALEENAVRRALQTTAGNVTKAAALLEIGKATLYRKMKEYGIE